MDIGYKINKKSDINQHPIYNIKPANVYYHISYYIITPY